MTSAEAAAWAQFAAGLLTFGAACFAAFYTKTAPTRAAQLAEQLRKQNDEAHLHRREKRAVLLMMMQERGNISSPNAQQAVNSIPVVFAGDEKVLVAYRRLSGLVGPYTPERLRLYLVLTTEVARSAGFADVITQTDVDVGYFISSVPPADIAGPVLAEQKRMADAAERLCDLLERNVRAPATPGPQ